MAIGEFLKDLQYKLFTQIQAFLRFQKLSFTVFFQFRNLY